MELRGSMSTGQLDEKESTIDKPGSRWPDYRADMPPRPSVVAIYRTDGGKVGT